MFSMTVKIQADRDGYFIRVPAAYIRKNTLAEGEEYVLTFTPARKEQKQGVVAK
jgi:hypothetical protein